MARVLLTDAGGGNTISAIRSLGKKGIDVVCADESAFYLVENKFTLRIHQTF